MAKPLDLPRWATDADYVAPAEAWDGFPTKIAPLDAKKDQGFSPKEKPPAQYLDWLFNLVYQWLKWIDDGIWTAIDLTLTGSLAVVNVVASGFVEGPAVYYTDIVSRVVPNSLAVNPLGSHLLSLGVNIYAASNHPVYWPLEVQVGDHIRQLILDFEKNTDNSVTNEYDLVKFIGGVESSVTGVPGTNNSNAIGAIAYARTGDWTVDDGALYYFKLTPGAGITPAADRSYELTLRTTRPPP